MTNKKYKILIMSAPIGSGHALAAEALKDEFKKLKSGDRVYFEDIIAVLPDGKDRYLNSMKFKIK